MNPFEPKTSDEKDVEIAEEETCVLRQATVSEEKKSVSLNPFVSTTDEDVFIDCQIDYEIKKSGPKDSGGVEALSSHNSSEDEADELVGKQTNSDYDNLNMANTKHVRFFFPIEHLKISDFCLST